MSVLLYSELKNNGIEYARRENGAWFYREGYYGYYGWTQTKWAKVKNQESMSDFENGCGIVKQGFNNRFIFTRIEDSKVRLPRES